MEVSLDAAPFMPNNCRALAPELADSELGELDMVFMPIKKR
jgi:hypothetical protein